MKTVSVVALGCPKNTVEAEYLLGMLGNKGYFITVNAQEADIIIIHTCSFIYDARTESEKCINDMLLLKKKKDVKVYVSGCLPQLLKEEMLKNFPLIDGCAGTGALDKIPALISGKKTENLFTPGGLNASKYRVLSSSLPSAYLKIAEGCSHSCSFCIIPKLRGKFKSRSVESLCDEAECLSEAGVRELILIAQDTSAYGLDLYKSFSLDKLLSRLAKIKGLKWIRLMYAHPSSITDKVLDVFEEYKNICSYMDIPIQHISANMLAAMKRPLGTRRIIEKIKKRLPGISLRTSIISGFPGETEADVRELAGFISEGHFLYAGVFQYSDQKEAPSSKLSKHISAETAKARRIEIENAQYRVFESKIRSLKNTETEFFAEKCFKKGEKHLTAGRTAFQAPEIDGTALIVSGKALKRGGFYKAVIKGGEGYNIKAELSRNEPALPRERKNELSE